MTLFIFVLIMIAWLGCLIPLGLFWRDVKRARVAPVGASLRFIVSVLLVVVPLNLLTFVLAMAFDVPEEMLMIAAPAAALLGTTLAYRRQRRRLTVIV